MSIHDVVMKLLLEQPYYGYVASSVAFIEDEKISTIKMASIPDLVVTYNPIWFQTLSNPQKTGVVIHELLHVILLHQYRRNNRDIILWSVACDMAVNEMIPVDYRSIDAVTVERMEGKIKGKMERNRNAEYYYQFISKLDEFRGFTSMNGDNILISDGKSMLQVQKLSEEKATSMEINSLKQNLAQSMEDAVFEGQLPTALDHQIEELYRDATIDWRVILKRFLIGRGRMITRKSYKRQSRRYEELPGTKRSVGVTALIAIDESGSIPDAMTQAFYQELKEINKITGTSMLVTRFDTECTEPVPLTTFVTKNKREKRGGTDFCPIFQLADQRKIPLVIIFTDGDGKAPETANQNTLWVLTKNARKPASFGYSISFGG